MIPWLIARLGLGPLIGIAGVIAITTAGAGFIAWQRHDARSDLKEEINDQNNDATRRALEADLDRRACSDAGRVWDFATGECTGPF